MSVFLYSRYDASVAKLGNAMDRIHLNKRRLTSYLLVYDLPVNYFSIYLSDCYSIGAAVAAAVAAAAVRRGPGPGSEPRVHATTESGPWMRPLKGKRKMT